MSDSMPGSGTEVQVGGPGGGPRRDDTHPLIPGYEVLREIGRGGMGTVYEAEDLRLHRRVAIKVMKRDVAADAIARERFLREARTQAAVDHEHVVPIHSVSDGGGTPYLVMPLLRGETLAARLKRDGQLTVGEAARVAREVADGLAAAHAKGLIHRDVKPDNVWLEGDRGRVKLLDFGLARLAEESKDLYRLTHTGDLIGTPAYMSPEQAAGKRIDARSDLFSLGVVLYEMTTGRRPFTGDSHMSILTALATHTPPPAADVNPGVPTALSRLTSGLLIKSPEQRLPGSAELLSADLLRIERECLERPLSHDPQPKGSDRGGRRRFLQASSYTLLGFAVGAGGMRVLGVRQHETTAPPPGPAQPDGAAIPSGLPGPTPLQHTPYLKAGAVLSLAASTDGQTVIAGMEDGTIKVWNPNRGGAVAELGKHDGPVWSVNLTADGNTVVSASGDGTVQLWDMNNTGAATQRTGINNQYPVRSAAMSADKKLIVTGDLKGRVRVWETSEISPLDLSTAIPTKPKVEFRHAGSINAVAFDPKAKRVASGSANKSAILWDMEKGTALHRLNGHEGPIYSLAFSPEGDRLATASWDHNVMIWNTQDGKLVRAIDQAHAGSIWSAAFGPLEEVMVTAGNDGRVRLWGDKVGGQQGELARHDGAVHVVLFTAAGRQILSGGHDGKICLWNVEANQQPR